jgi:hypothetical protein
VTPISENGWSEYEKLVLFRLDDLATQMTTVKGEVQSLKTAMALTKLKLAAISFIFGSLGSAFVYAFVNKAVTP